MGWFRRRAWAWPVGIVGNVLLFFVYITVMLRPGRRTRPAVRPVRPPGLLHHHQHLRLVALEPGPQAEPARRRTSRRSRRAGPRCASASAVGGVLARRRPWSCQQVFATTRRLTPDPSALRSGGSSGATRGSSSARSIATYAMARGWNEFWLAWIGVDLVGVPLLAPLPATSPRRSCTRSTPCSSSTGSSPGFGPPARSGRTWNRRRPPRRGGSTARRKVAPLGRGATFRADRPGTAASRFRPGVGVGRCSSATPVRSRP